MPVAAVLGWPLAHTLSPALHQAAYRAAGLDGWTYEARPTRPEELAAALEEVRAGRLAGVNLTTPHKQPAAALVDVLERPADRLGAVNTVFLGEGGLVGANTDVAGAVWALGSQLGLRDHRWPGTGPAVLLGTGGVALAVAFAWSRLAAARRVAAIWLSRSANIWGRPDWAAVALNAIDDQLDAADPELTLELESEALTLTRLELSLRHLVADRLAGFDRRAAGHPRYEPIARIHAASERMLQGVSAMEVADEIEEALAGGPPADPYALGMAIDLLVKTERHDAAIRWLDLTIEGDGSWTRTDGAVHVQEILIERQRRRR